MASSVIFSGAMLMAPPPASSHDATPAADEVPSEDIIVRYANLYMLVSMGAGSGLWAFAH